MLIWRTALTAVIRHPWNVSWNATERSTHKLQLEAFERLPVATAYSSVAKAALCNFIVANFYRVLNGLTMLRIAIYKLQFTIRQNRAVHALSTGRFFPKPF